MPMKCTICPHEKLEEINRALMSGLSLRNVAQRFSVSMHSLHRHKRHIPARMVQAQQAKEVTKADTLLEQVVELRDKAMSILEQAEQAGDLRTALQGIKEARACLELLAKLQGELAQNVNVTMTVQQRLAKEAEEREGQQWLEADPEGAEMLQELWRRKSARGRGV